MYLHNSMYELNRWKFGIVNTLYVAETVMGI